MYQRKNFAYGTVLTPPDPAASGTSIVLNSGQGARFPNTSGGQYVCVVKQVSVPCTPDNSEVVLVTTHDPAGDTFTVTRTQESSSARTIVAGDEFYLAPTDGVWDQIDVLTTKGDLLSQSAAGVYARLAIGTNTYALVADSGETTGLKWVDLATRTEVLSNKTLTLPQINDTSSDHQYVTAVSELTADRTVTLPLLTANDTFVFRDHANVAINFNYPRGYLVNGKIVPSVASNNLTVAIKGMDGNDPSATNPVYCRIGDTIRSITSALSVTKNAGTNWFNCGATVLAAKEVDYFVYLGYNATDGVVVGFSRIVGQEYDSFSATSTNEKYCAISTITNAAAGDDYELIGRFAATLSAGAGYTWSVPTFTNKNLIQRPILSTRVLEAVVVPVWTGTTAPSGTPSTLSHKYQYVNGVVKDWQAAYGYTAAVDITSFTLEVPFDSVVFANANGNVGTAGSNQMNMAAIKYSANNKIDAWCSASDLTLFTMFIEYVV